MQWLILKDLINKPGGSTPSRVGRGYIRNENDRNLISGLPREGLKHALKGFTENWSDEFRLKDDDGAVYYEGRCNGLDDADQDNAFAPLDWAMNDAGCTTMEVRKVGSATWEVL
ncbi:hypothetical protein [Cupriavidus metallidurans]|uniref:hypothetical protein n=1 Tax=Cupriavidus metallidurans TaxID=119219 RepID=UPI001CCA9FA9|nr:hypothetical protein [Cupriavidus metallidurans]UBM12804.1 hypothetical protein LAI70_28025 [Cupriavidus metallidurans]